MIKGKKTRQKYNFQGKSARAKNWFDLDHEWLKKNFMTREPDFYRKKFKLNLGVIIHKTIKIWSTNWYCKNDQKSILTPRSTTDTISPKVT